LRALENAKPGFETFIIAAADTVMSRSSAELAAEVFPGVELVKEIGERETLLSIDKARRMLGYAPEHSWRDHAEALIPEEVGAATKLSPSYRPRGR
jgi:nucleoside-diphosphate-sugar epimerase